LTIKELQRQNFDIEGVVMIESRKNENLKMNGLDIQENRDAIESFSTCKVLGIIPYLSSFHEVNLQDEI
jgi:hypothetical protein